LFVFNKSWHGALIIDAIEGIQKFHSAPTLQIGGLAIVAALLNAPAELKSLTGMF
jgi:UDP-N-acetylmuramyl pentapeptide phosphotransferase/UDP-N-acetylglucosamine-1-phosphate transferase